MNDDTKRFIEGCRGIAPNDLGVIIDVGAASGVEAVEMKAAFPNTHVYAVDPMFLDVDFCLRGGVVPVVGAASYGSGLRYFSISLQRGLCGFYDRGIEYQGGAYVSTFRIDDIGLTIAAMKIDAEGAAMDVLMGAPKALRDCFLVQVETETARLFAGQTLEPKVFTRLKKSKFEMAWIDRSGDQAESQWVKQR